MQQKTTAYLLTGFMMLVPVVYTQEASAATLLTPASAAIFNQTVSSGSFQNSYDVIIDGVFSAYNLSGSFSFQSVQVLASLTTDFSNASVTNTSGISSASVELLDSASAVIATGSLSSFSVTSAPTLVDLGFLPPFYQGLLTTYNTITFNNIPVLGAGNYKLAVAGSSTGGAYTGSLSVSPIVPTAAVPLPGTIWMLLTGALGILGVRRKNTLKA